MLTIRKKKWSYKSPQTFILIPYFHFERKGVQSVDDISEFIELRKEVEVSGVLNGKMKA